MFFLFFWKCNLIRCYNFYTTINIIIVWNWNFCNIKFKSNTMMCNWKIIYSLSEFKKLVVILERFLSPAQSTLGNVIVNWHRWIALPVVVNELFLVYFKSNFQICNPGTVVHGQGRRGRWSFGKGQVGGR